MRDDRNRVDLDQVTFVDPDAAGRATRRNGGLMRRLWTGVREILGFVRPGTARISGGFRRGCSQGTPC